MSPPDTTARPAEATNRRLARTINLGLDLGAPEEAGWTIDVGDEHLERCAQAGSSAVRLGSCFGLHASPPTPTSCTLERLERLERVIVAASERGLAARRQASTRSEEPDDRPSACDQRNHALAPPQNNSTDGKATEQAPLEAAPVGRVGTGQTRIVTITELHTLRSHGGLVPALPSSILEPLWVQVSALLPTRQVHHPLGCHRQRVPDRIVFDKLIQLLVFGCGYRRIADATCSATTLRRRRDEWITAGVAEHLRLAVLAAYDRMLGLDLEHLAVDGCITKAPCGGQTAGRSPVDRGKQGLKRSMVTEAGGIPLGAIPAAANRRDDGLLAATLDTIIAVGAPPAQPTVHLDAGYDYQSCREVLAERGMVGQIATRGVPAPVQAGRRWVIERTHAWGNQYGKLRWCTERRRLVVEFWLALASAAMVCGRLLRRAWTHYRWEDRPRRRP